MLRVILSMETLPFAQLMKIYAETNCREGKNRWRHESEYRQCALAEDAFYSYLKDCFFYTAGATYFLWESGGEAVSAVRCEPYKDSVLLAALETLPSKRGSGAATALLTSVLHYLKEKNIEKVYVNIHRTNLTSIRLHKRCGFQLYKPGARLLDGSYSMEYDTYVSHVSGIIE